jgi:hypothetical protein
MKEDTKRRKAFDLYVRLGPKRSLEELHRRLQEQPELIGLSRGPNRSTLDAWSSALHWQARLQDLELEARLRDQEAQVQALRDMDERQIKEALALQQKGIERLNQMNPDELPPSDAIRAVMEGMKAERLIRGQPTENIRQEGTTIHGHIDLSGFTNEELRRIVEFAERGLFGSGES